MSDIAPIPQPKIYTVPITAKLTQQLIIGLEGCLKNITVPSEQIKARSTLSALKYSNGCVRTALLEHAMDILSTNPKSNQDLKKQIVATLNP